MLDHHFGRSNNKHSEIALHLRLAFVLPYQPRSYRGYPRNDRQYRAAVFAAFVGARNLMKRKAESMDIQSAEIENAEEKGLVRIYDAGQAKYVLNLE